MRADAHKRLHEIHLTTVDALEAAAYLAGYPAHTARKIYAGILIKTPVDFILTEGAQRRASKTGLSRFRADLANLISRQAERSALAAP